jgi:hypothetical protein
MDALPQALAYARRGFRVIRVRPRSKLPADKGWPTLATTDAKTLRKWFAKGGGNVGIATGPQSGLFVLDVDGDPLKLLGKRDMPNTALQSTGGGGFQFFYRWAADLDEVTTTRAGILPSIDTRGAGGYVVAPPSVHPSGRRYEWVDGCGPGTRLAAPPAWLIELLRQRPAGARTPDEEWRRIAGEGAKKGARNTTLARLAGHLFAHSTNIDPIVARELLLAWSQARCTPPMDEDEARRTIKAIALREIAKCAA